MPRLCACGCGRETSLATHTSVKNGRIKGQPCRYILGHNNQNIAEIIKRIGVWNKGKTRVEDPRIPQPWLGKKRLDVSGKNNYQWIEDRSKLKDDHKDRGGQLHREWSRSVKNRDCWKCKIFNDDCSGQVVAHHILPWRDYSELRYEVNNGITLCHFHHPRKRNDEMRLSPYFQELVKANLIWLNMRANCL